MWSLIRHWWFSKARLLLRLGQRFFGPHKSGQTDSSRDILSQEKQQQLAREAWCNQVQQRAPHLLRQCQVRSVAPPEWPKADADSFDKPRSEAKPRPVALQSVASSQDNPVVSFWRHLFRQKPVVTASANQNPGNCQTRVPVDKWGVPPRQSQPAAEFPAPLDPCPAPGTRPAENEQAKYAPMPNDAVTARPQDGDGDGQSTPANSSAWSLEPRDTAWTTKCATAVGDSWLRQSGQHQPGLLEPTLVRHSVGRWKVTPDGNPERDRPIPRDTSRNRAGISQESARRASVMVSTPALQQEMGMIGNQSAGLRWDRAHQADPWPALPPALPLNRQTRFDRRDREYQQRLLREQMGA